MEGEREKGRLEGRKAGKKPQGKMQMKRNRLIKL